MYGEFKVSGSFEGPGKYEEYGLYWPGLSPSEVIVGSKLITMGEVVCRRFSGLSAPN